MTRIVNDTIVDVVSTVADGFHTGSLGVRKIFISKIDEIVDFTTKQKDEKYI